MEQKEDEASRKGRLLQLVGDYTDVESEEDLQWISKPLKIKRWVVRTFTLFLFLFILRLYYFCILTRLF